MKFTKEDKRDLLKLADIIEKKEFFNKKNLPEDKRDGSQFNLEQWFFECGMPSCAAGHAVCEFPERFGCGKRVKNGVKIYLRHHDFAEAFNLDADDSLEITDVDQYPDSLESPEPIEVANKIRMIVKRQEVKA